jgi:NDP-sugar pyrophosphorylase family protein
MKTAILLAGGKGTRLGKTQVPKAMIKVGKKTLIQRQINWLIREGFKHVIVCLGHLHKQVRFKAPSIQVTIVIEKRALGTGGAVKNAYYESGICLPKIYVLNVDDLANVDTNDALGTKTPCIVVKENPASVWTDDGQMFPQKASFTHIGHTILSDNDLVELASMGSLETWLAERNGISIYKHDGEWHTANTKEQFIMLNKQYGGSAR